MNMEAIRLEGTEDTPKVIFDTEEEVMEISGRSFAEDANEFFKPIIKWLEEYSKSPKEKTILDLKLVYFSTATSKLLLEVLLKFEEMNKNGDEVLIRWYYADDDEDMEEAGEEYEDIVDVPFERISYTVKRSTTSIF